MRHLKTLFDWPPVWLLAGLALVWGSDRLVTLQNFPRLGAGLVLAGLALMGVAAAQMVMARTTVNPRGQPAALVTGGVFAISRNPIYLGDALVLLGATGWLGAPLGLAILAGFVAVITRRFIRPEEARLQAAFGAEFTVWAARVRRWL